MKTNVDNEQKAVSLFWRSRYWLISSDGFWENFGGKDGGQWWKNRWISKFIGGKVERII